MYVHLVNKILKNCKWFYRVKQNRDKKFYLHCKFHIIHRCCVNTALHFFSLSHPTAFLFPFHRCIPILIIDLFSPTFPRKHIPLALTETWHLGKEDNLCAHLKVKAIFFVLRG